METFLYQALEHINQFPRWSVFLITFLSGFIQVAFPPYPGEVVLTICGCIERNKNIIQSLLLFFTYWIAIVSANMGLYTIGVYKGEELLSNRFVAKFITSENKEKINTWLNKYGLLVFLIAIYIPGMYLPTIFFSGVMKYRRRQAFLGMAIATLIHDILIFFGGRFLGLNLQHFLSQLQGITLVLVLGVVAICLLYQTIKHVRHRMQQ